MIYSRAATAAKDANTVDVYCLLAYMATSGGHFSRPSGMGKLLELVSICNSLNSQEGMTIFGRNDTNTEGMTIIRKE